MPSTMRVIVFRSSTTSTGSTESTTISHPLPTALPVIASSSPTRATIRAARRPDACNLHDSYGDQVARAGHDARLILMRQGIWAPALRFYGGQADDIVRDVGCTLAPGSRNIKSAPVGEWLECVGQAYDCLGGTQHKV